MISALIIQHADNEGSGTLGNYLARFGTLHRVVLSRGDHLPRSPKPYDAVISLGGPLQAGDDDNEFLKQEKAFLRTTATAGIPVLGICLGAQLLAAAFGGDVVRAKQPEIGWYEIQLTGEGHADPLFRGIDGPVNVVQWHEDTIRLPEQAVLLATGSPCRPQAFRLRESAYGLQFHIEVTRRMLEEWFAFTPDGPDIVGQFGSEQSRLERNSHRVFRNFLAIVLAAQQQRRQA